MLISLTIVIILVCICISNHRVHLKYIQQFVKGKQKKETGAEQK